MQLRGMPRTLLRGSQLHAVEPSPKGRTRLQALTVWQRTGQWRVAGEVFGLSRATLYRWRQRYDPQDLGTLEDRSRRPHRVRQPQTPWPVVERLQALQVDGGSEFAAVFEQECQRRRIPLFVLPPRSPKLNGHVERAQRTHSEEFYECYDGDLELGALRAALRVWEHTYNHIRPHEALGYLTPAEFLADHALRGPSSHMS